MPARKKEKIIICLDCGAEVRTKSGRTQRCKECAAKRKKEQNRKALEKQKEERRLERSEDQERFSYQFCDSPENIQKCLNCTRPSCRNCLSTTSARKRYRLKKERMKNAQGDA